MISSQNRMSSPETEHAFGGWFLESFFTLATKTQHLEEVHPLVNIHIAIENGH